VESIICINSVHLGRSSSFTTFQHLLPGLAPHEIEYALVHKIWILITATTLGTINLFTVIISQMSTFRDDHDKAQYDTTWSGSNIIITAMWTLLDKSPKQSLHSSVAVKVDKNGVDTGTKTPFSKSTTTVTNCN